MSVLFDSKRTCKFAFIAVLLSSTARTQGAAQELPIGTAKAPTSVVQARTERRQWDDTVWASEIAAGSYSKRIDAFWDRLRQTQQPLQGLAGFRFDRLHYGVPEKESTLDLGIKRIQFGAPSLQMSQQQWVQVLERFSQRGFELTESEWHHSSFRIENGIPFSLIDFEMHVLQHISPPENRTAESERQAARVIVRGKLEIEWAGEKRRVEDQLATAVTIKSLALLTRLAPPAFEHTFTYERRTTDVASAHPIIVHDLDKNGLPDIIISRWNRVYWNEGKGKFREARFLDEFTPLAEAGLVADFTDDGQADFLSVNKTGQVVLFAGKPEGKFEGAQIVSNVRVPSALCITAGDIDGDGDLDLWIPQYKPAYIAGQMPTPYYDANDGEPAFLLVNQGNAYFADQTNKAGLAAKRNRRTYSASFVDIDDDLDLDLLVVSDYAGVDLYRNTGDGTFRDVTDQLLSEKHLFGMAHTFGDFNRDARLDFYAIGMSSTTARRLDAMNLSRADRADIATMRSSMGFGNRVYQWTGARFRTPPFATQLARTGWSWGATTFDYDLDGDEDIYVANGFRSGKSCKDYCSTFWRHDIYTGNSKSNPVVASLFSDSMRDLNAGKMSWNGYEHNALLQNGDGRGFENIAFLMGVGSEFDSRAVIGNDLDGDGRPDLIVTEYEFTGQGYVMKLHVFRNTLPRQNNWIGIRLPETGGHAGLFGTTAVLTSADGKQIRQLVAGDSFLSQHDNAFHFGLAQQQTVDTIDIRWPNGKARRFVQPKLNQYHSAEPTSTTSRQ